MRGRSGQWLAIAALGGWLGCRDASPPNPQTARPVPRPPPSAYKELPTGSDFAKIKALLSEDPHAQIRAYELYPLVDEICRIPKSRRKFIADGAAWVEVRTQPSDKAWAVRKTIDTFEHVATSCFRSQPQAAFDILESGKKVLPKSYRFDVALARLQAAGGDFAAALAAAEEARKEGSTHAVALAATIRARMARDEVVGYREGMLDPAIEIASVVPGPNWSLVNTTAVLTTRGRLLTERAIWEDADRRKATLTDARVSYARLAAGPFPKRSQEHALDMLCFDVVTIGNDDAQPCLQASLEFSNLGAAVLTGQTIVPPLDGDRLDRIVAVRKSLDELPEGAMVIVVGRGDESELTAWARPAAEVLRRVGRRKPRLIVMDRTNDKRSGALLSRIIELSGTTAFESIDAGRDTFAMPCLAALVAGRTKPKACPFEEAQVKRLSADAPYGFAILVGRDLDAEIDDLKLYELPAMLMSFRKPLIENGLKAHLKNASDAWIMSADAEARAGSLRIDAAE